MTYLADAFTVVTIIQSKRLCTPPVFWEWDGVGAIYRNEINTYVHQTWRYKAHSWYDLSVMETVARIEVM